MATKLSALRVKTLNHGEKEECTEYEGLVFLAAKKRKAKAFKI